jgi:hypothetical protein
VIPANRALYRFITISLRSCTATYNMEYFVAPTLADFVRHRRPVVELSDLIYYSWQLGKFRISISTNSKCGRDGHLRRCASLQERGQRSVLPHYKRRDQSMYSNRKSKTTSCKRMMRATLLTESGLRDRNDAVRSTEINTIAEPDWRRCQSSFCQDHYWTVRAV